MTMVTWAGLFNNLILKKWKQIFNESKRTRIKWLEIPS